MAQFNQIWMGRLKYDDDNKDMLPNTAGSYEYDDNDDVHLPPLGRTQTLHDNGLVTVETQCTNPLEALVRENSLKWSEVSLTEPNDNNLAHLFLSGSSDEVVGGSNRFGDSDRRET